MTWVTVHPTFNPKELCRQSSCVPVIQSEVIHIIQSFSLTSCSSPSRFVPSLHYPLIFSLCGETEGPKVSLFGEPAGAGLAAMTEESNYTIQCVFTHVWWFPCLVSLLPSESHRQKNSLTKQTPRKLLGFLARLHSSKSGIPTLKDSFFNTSWASHQVPATCNLVVVFLCHTSKNRKYLPSVKCNNMSGLPLCDNIDFSFFFFSYIFHVMRLSELYFLNDIWAESRLSRSQSVKSCFFANYWANSRQCVHRQPPREKQRKRVTRCVTDVCCCSG